MALKLLAFYLTLAVFMTWPVAWRLKTRVPGTGGDLWVHWWNLWWVKRALVEGGSLFHTDLLFYPQGLNLAYHNIAWLHVIQWLPLQTLFGGVPAFGMVFLLTIALNGIGMFYLAREFTRSSGAALVAGLVYAFWPFTLAHFNQINLMSVSGIPLVLLGLRRIIQRGRVTDALFTALFLFLTGLARWHLLFYGGLLFGSFLLWSLLTEWALWQRRTLALLALAITLAGLALLPLATPLLTSQLTREHPQDIFVQDRREGQTDLLAYWIPNRSHPLWGKAVRPVYDLFDVNSDGIVYLGYAALALALYGLVRRWRQARFWLLAAIVVVLMAMGANLRIAGHIYPSMPTPYRLVSGLAKILRQTDRFNIALATPVAMLSAWGTTAILSARPRRQTWLLAILSGLILFDYVTVPYATIAPQTPVWYELLAAQDGDFAILPIPMGIGNSKDHMFYQTTHGKPTVTGETARPPREAFAFIQANPLLQGMSKTREFDPHLPDVSRQLAQLAQAGVRYLVLHPEMDVPPRVARWQDWLTFTPIYTDGQTIVYHTQPQHGRDFDFVAELGDGIGLISGTLSSTALAQDGLLEADLRWGTYTAPTRDWAARLFLVSLNGQLAQSADGEPCTGWPTSEWGANAVARGKAALRVNPFIAGGSYTVKLSLVDPTNGEEMDQAAVLGQVEVQAVERVFATPHPDIAVESVFGQDLRLLGYDLRQSADALTLTLHWQATRRMDVAYKMFVHLFDASSGQLVTQLDVMPRNWGYPTHWWESGEVVSDKIELSLAQAPPGAYQLRVGVYDPDTGERLVVQDADWLALQAVIVP